ncbi:amino acid adenylation domain-containing protein [Micromonospora pattaloongensis]|uniref:Amino acid adenylation domain-containing protein n=1 Tax=Micromonospora pattaloongensis TaxID=405436 RepID=A0A1H3JUY7_9ACTN|nr:non-ribosomal peptide synthetase [Micromonospora pattaloongensis]SDY43325.1 amino acid adenylation domain-containing protein [Micromonospora pattaloongensis]
MQTLPSRFADQARRTPDAVAVDGPDESLTYAELDSRANQLAWHLTGLGLTAEEPVALLLDRSVGVIVAMLAIAKAGGTYVPVHTAFPAGRMAEVVHDAGARLLLIDAAHDPVPFETAAETIRLDLLDLSRQPRHAPAVVQPEAALAYVMYTSGSTGRPKGVAISQEALVQLATDSCWAQNSSAGAVLFHSPHAFDLTVYEIWTPLLGGGRVVVAPPEALTAAALEAMIDRYGLTAVGMTSGLFEAMADTAPSLFAPLREVSVGGDVVSPSIVVKVAAACPDTVIRHIYGPTEATLIVTQVEVSGPGRPAAPPQFATFPLGAARDGMAVYVLDDDLVEVPADEVGELYISGAGVARGYLGMQAATADRFVPCPYGSPGERMYRTGDLVRRTTDGDLIFIGRADLQLKIRGNRVEIGEIEEVIARHPEVSQAVVVGRRDEAGNVNLTAYIVPVPRGRVSVRALQEHVREFLPDYMVPYEFMRLKHLPLTPNGKIDRAALPEPARRSGRSARTPQEVVLCDVFAELLGRSRVGVDENFFELGGHSLMAVRLAARIRAFLGREIAVRDLFESPTVAGLARRLSAADAARPPITAVGRPDRVPLSFAQARLWFINQLEGPSGNYNIPYAVRIRGDLDTGALHAALGDVVARHETLRTTYPEQDGVPYQRIEPALEIDLPVIAASADTVTARISEIANAGYDLTTDAPLRAALIELPDQEHVLVLVLHHIAGDGWSTEPLLEELSTAYAARLAGAAPDWAPLPIQYADYSLWQRRWLGEEKDPASVLNRQLAFWRETLDGAPVELALPTDRPRPAAATGRGDQVEFHLSATVHHALTDIAHASKASVFMVVQAGLLATLTHLGAGTDLTIGTVTAGRTDQAVEDLIGFFVNTLVLRTSTAGNPTFTELVTRTRDTDLAAFAHQDTPFERIVEALNPHRHPTRHPLFQTLLAWQNNDQSPLNLQHTTTTDEPFDYDAAKFDLVLSIQENRDSFGVPEGIEGSLEYALDLFDRSTAQRMADTFTQLITAVAAAPETPLADIALHGDQLADLVERARNAASARALPEPARRSGRSARTPQEVVLCDVFAELLGRSRVGVDENFFELGGHSLMAVRLAARIRAFLGREIAVRDLFESPTVAGLARRLSAADAARPPITAVGRPDRVPLSFAQARLWFINQLEGPSGNYNIPYAVRIRGDLDTGALHAALGDVVARHETLRTTYPEQDGVPYQRIEPALEIDLPVIAASADTVTARISEIANAGYDLTTDAPLRAALIELPDQEHVLVLVLHHIAGDGWSTEPLLEELSTAYAARLAGAAPDWAPLPIQYADYSLWQRRWLGEEKDPASVLNRQLAFWRETLDGAPVELALPTDRPRPAAATGRGDQVEFHLSATVHHALTDIAHASKASVFMVVQAGLLATLTHLGAGTDLTIGTVTAGRTDQAVEDLIGFFVNTLVLRTSTAGNPTFTELVTRTRDTDLAAFAHQDTPFERIVEALNPHRHPTRHPLFQTLLAWQNNDQSPLNLQHTTTTDEPFDYDAAKFDLLFSMADTFTDDEATGIEGVVEYAVDLFDRATVEQLVDVFTQLLTAVAAAPETPLADITLVGAEALAARVARWTPAAAPGSTASPRRGPGTPHETAIEGLFAEILGVDHVDAHDNFFELGGHSLLAVTLAARLRALGLPIRVRDIFSAPTPHELAVAGTTPAQAGSMLAPLVTLRGTGDEAPLFLFPPISGLSWAYAALLPHLPGDHPVYGLQVPRLEFSDGPKLIAALADLIRNAVGDQPVHLAGWSIGGVVAHAVAADLARGGQVVSVSLIDAYPFAEQRAALDLGPDDFAADVVAGLATALPGDPSAPITGLAGLTDRLAADWALTGDEAGEVVSAALRYRHVANDLGGAVYEGDITVITAGRDAAAGDYRASMWRPYVTGQITEDVADADHFGMLTGPAVRTVGTALAEALGGRIHGHRAVG